MPENDVASAALSEATVFIKPKRARPFFGRHPWVLESAILRVDGKPASGAVVDVVTHDGNFIARGLWNASSRIRIRLYTFVENEALDETFWRTRIENAISLRQHFGLHSEKGGCRLINSEGDSLSGIIVDQYGSYLALQVTALAMAERLDLICDSLEHLLQPKGILLRGAERGLGKLEGLHLPDRQLRGERPEGPIFVEEHGLRFGVDLTEGQKTGYYLDQRENRQAAAAYAAGRRVLDMFCYSGGFGVASAVSGNASSVLSVDSSMKAVSLARANAELNNAPTMSVEQADAFEKLSSLHEKNEKFGMVILDPPKFARSRASASDALRAYHRINRLGVDLLDPGGILVTCSCSGAITRDDFLMMLSAVGQRSGRTLQLLEHRGAAIDHPVNLHCLEGEYLKCSIVRVQ